MVLCTGHGFHFLLFLLWLEHRKVEHRAGHVVALTQFLQLRFRHVQLSTGLQIHTVDDEVRMDVLSFHMGADQNLIVLKPLCQFQCTVVSCDWINCFTLREALHHVIEHCAVRLMVEQLGAQEVVIDTFGTTVDAGDQSQFAIARFHFPLNILHHQSHAAATLSSFVVGEVYDCDTYHLRYSCSARTAALMFASPSATLSRYTTVICFMFASAVS